MLVRFTPALLAAAVRVGLLSLLALALLLGTGVLCAGGLAFVQGEEIAPRANLLAGLICGLIAWLFIAAFHLRRETLYLPALDDAWFLHTVRILLKEMGYQVSARGGVSLCTRPRFHSFLLGGGVHVVVKRQRALITGPKVCVEMLHRRLRVQVRLSKFRRALHSQNRGVTPLGNPSALRLHPGAEQFGNASAS